MDKIKAIGHIKNKIFGNVKNKQWFKKYKYKDVKDHDDFEIKILSSALYFVLLLLLSTTYTDANILGLKEIMIIIGNCGLSVFMGLFTAHKLNKNRNKRNKKEIMNFIDNSELIKEDTIANLVSKKETFSGSNILIDFIKSQMLEKDEIEQFKLMLNKYFDKNELNHVFYNEKLNEILKNKKGINYNYVLSTLNLLECNEKNKQNLLKVNNIKTCLFEEKKVMHDLIKEKIKV